jgi:hypothetical protein
MKLTTHLYLVSRLRMSGTLTLPWDKFVVTSKSFLNVDAGNLHRVTLLKRWEREFESCSIHGWVSEVFLLPVTLQSMKCTTSCTAMELGSLCNVTPMVCTAKEEALCALHTHLYYRSFAFQQHSQELLFLLIFVPLGYAPVSPLVQLPFPVSHGFLFCEVSGILLFSICSTWVVYSL